MIDRVEADIWDPVLFGFKTPAHYTKKREIFLSNSHSGKDISSVQFSCLIVTDSLQPHGLQHARLSCPSPTPVVCSNSMSLELVMSSNHLILCSPLLLLPSIFPSIRVVSNESALPIRCPKYWSFSFSSSPSNEHPGLISFRMDWLYLLAV